MQILITGATGFVGSAVVRRLRAERHDVHALVRDASQAAWLAELGVQTFQGELGDPNTIAEAAMGCEVVVHCAGLGSRHASRQALAWCNVAGTENVLQAARYAGCRRLVHLSCADVSLLNCDRVHWKEDRQFSSRPLDAHARSKLLAEELALVQSDENFSVIALRPALLWGPNDPHLLPQLCREAFSGGVRLFGDGANLIATTHIDNLVDAVLSATTSRTTHGLACYITDNEFMTAAEFLGSLCQAIGAGPPRRGQYWYAYTMGAVREALGLSGPWRGDVVKRGRSWLFDIQQATQELGYTPRIDLEQGMKQLSDWVESSGGMAAIARIDDGPRAPAIGHSTVNAASPIGDSAVNAASMPSRHGK